MLDQPGNQTALRVAIDVAHPLAYLALHPTLALLDELAVRAEWLPISVSPFYKPLPQGADRGSQHRRLRAQYEHKDIHRYAAARGLTLHNLERRTDSTLAGRGLLTAKRHGAERAYLERVFEAHWAEELDIQDSDVIEDLLRQNGIQDELVSESEFAALQREVAELGLFSSPAYLIEDEIFLGRAHLPMIRWILSGRQGTPPI